MEILSNQQPHVKNYSLSNEQMMEPYLLPTYCLIVYKIQRDRTFPPQLPAMLRSRDIGLRGQSSMDALLRAGRASVVVEVSRFE